MVLGPKLGITEGKKPKFPGNKNLSRKEIFKASRQAKHVSEIQRITGSQSGRMEKSQIKI